MLLALLAARAGGQTPAPSRHAATEASWLRLIEAAVREAIVESIRDRMAADAEVRIESLQVCAAPAPAATGDRLTATPEPGARAGRPARFSLSRVPRAALRPSAAGYAVVIVTVTLEHARAARAIARGESLAAEDVTTTRGEVGNVLLRRLPAASEVVGARALRDLLPGEVLTHALVVVRPTVQSGDVVALRVRGDGVVVQAEGVAAQSGEPGDTIRVVNRESRRTVKARVIAPGTVEVIQ